MLVLTERCCLGSLAHGVSSPWSRTTPSRVTAEFPDKFPRPDSTLERVGEVAQKFALS